MSNVFLAVFLETRGCCRLFIGFVSARRTIVSMASLCRGIVLKWNWIKQTIFRKSVDLKVRKDKMHRWETPRAKGLLLRASLSKKKRDCRKRKLFLPTRIFLHWFIRDLFDEAPENSDFHRETSSLNNSRSLGSKTLHSTRGIISKFAVLRTRVKALSAERMSPGIK